MSKSVRRGLLAAAFFLAAPIAAEAAMITPGVTAPGIAGSSGVTRAAWVCDGPDDCVWRDDEPEIDVYDDDIADDAYVPVRPYVARPYVVETPVVVTPNCFWRRGVLGRQRYICP